MSTPASVVPVKTQKAEIQAGIVADLERLLARARAGELESILWFTEDAASRAMEWGASGMLDQDRSIGRLRIIEHSLLNSFAGVEEGSRR